MLFKQLEYYKSLSFKLNYNFYSRDAIEQIVFNSKIKDGLLISQFIYTAFNKFINECTNYNTRLWLKKKCNKYIYNYTGEKTINACMRYYITVKSKIVKEFVTKKVDLLITNLGPKCQIYLNNDTRLFLITKILNEFNPEVIIKYKYLVLNEFNEQIKKSNDKI